MPIRGSIKPPPKDGYPDIKFEGYVKRFGRVEASFVSAGMRMLMGEYKPSKVPTRAMILMYSKAGVERIAAEREAKNLPFAFLKEVIKNWPTVSEAANLTANPFQRRYED